MLHKRIMSSVIIMEEYQGGERERDKETKGYCQRLNVQEESECVVISRRLVLQTLQFLRFKTDHAGVCLLN